MTVASSVVAAAAVVAAVAVPAANTVTTTAAARAARQPRVCAWRQWMDRKEFWRKARILSPRARQVTVV
jgi:hypothetical protein